jgi:hypothetical protein
MPRWCSDDSHEYFPHGLEQRSELYDSPASIALVNLPVTQEVVRGQAFTFRIITNLTPSSISIVGGSLPTGLTLTGDTISGTTVAAAGDYAVQIKVHESSLTGTDDTETLTLRVVTPAFNFTNLPATPPAWLTRDFSLQLKTNTPATSIALLTGSLPPGLSLSGDTISGTPTGAEGDYAARFEAVNALTSTTGNLLIHVGTPAIRVFLRPHGSAAAARPGPDWGEIIAPLGQAITWDVSATAVGPIDLTPTTITLDGEPDWLSVSGTTLTGTPNDAATSVVTIRWSNGELEGTTTLTITVPAVRISSASSTEADEGQPFSFAFTSIPAGAVFSVIDPEHLPDGVFVEMTSPGHYQLKGRSDEVGEFDVTIEGRLGTETALQSFALKIRPVISIVRGGEIAGWVGDRLLNELVYTGGCEAQQWFISGEPPGVEVAALDCPGGPYEGTKRVVAISGSPSEPGIYDATVTVQVCCDGVPALYRRPVRFKVSGGLFLGWFHEEPRRELQVFLRSRAVRGVGLGDEGLYWKRGDDERLYILFRDDHSGSTPTGGSGGGGNGGGSDTPNGGVVVVIGDNNTTPDTGNNGGGASSTDAKVSRGLITTGFTELRLVIRPAEDPEEIVLLDLGGDLVTETIDGQTVFVLAFRVSSDALETALEAESRKSANAPASVSLNCVGEITWVRDGLTSSSHGIPIVIAQDIAR